MGLSSVHRGRDKLKRRDKIYDGLGYFTESSEVVEATLFIDHDILFVLGPALIVLLIAGMLMHFMQRGETDPMKRASAMLKTNLIMVGAFCLLLWFLLPTTPVLSTFGYPTTERDIESSFQLLKYLQDYNKAIVRTTQVVHWFIFVFIWWFLTSYFEFSKAITGEGKNDV